MPRKKSCCRSAHGPTIVVVILMFILTTGSGMVFGNQDDASTTTIIVMRHAEKVEPTGDCDLSIEGEARAQHLKEVLGWLPISTVFSTSAKRAMQTAKPLATCLGLGEKISLYGTVPEVVEAINSPGLQGKTVFVMGHMNTAKELIDLLGGNGSACPGIQHDEICIAQKMPDKKVQVLRLKYGTILEPMKCKAVAPE
jgi:phosphohistidine phosphatase SixA